MSTNTTEQKKPIHPFLTVAGLLGAVVGFYCGIMVFIPLAGAVIALLIAKRFAPATVKPFTTASAVLFGHWLWMLIAGLSVSVKPVIADLIIVFIGLLWLVLRPSIGPVLFLGIYEVITLVMNIIMIFHIEFGTSDHKALTAHIVLRVFALISLITGYRQFRNGEKVASEGGGA